MSLYGAPHGSSIGSGQRGSTFESAPLDNPSRQLSDFGSNTIKLSVRKEEDRSWHLHVTMPNFGLLTRNLPRLKQAFSTQRSYVSGASRPFFPEKFLLYGRPEVELNHFPRVDAPLLRFETDVEGLAEFLAQTCSLPMIISLLFRLNDDGTSVQISSGVIRPGHRYL